MANTTLNGEYIADKYIVTTTSYFRPVALLCSAKEGLQKGFPSGGRKLQAVCRVQRQMREDKSPPTHRYKASHFPPTKQVRSRTLQQLCTSQTDKKLPPCPRHSTKANQIIASKMAGTWGKFGEDEGGLEGEGTPSERGFLLPPRSFFSLQGLSLPLTPRK